MHILPYFQIFPDDMPAVASARDLKNLEQWPEVDYKLWCEADQEMSINFTETNLMFIKLPWKNYLAINVQKESETTSLLEQKDRILGIKIPKCTPYWHSIL